MALEFVEVVHAVVAYADGADFAFFDGFNELGSVSFMVCMFEGAETYGFPCAFAAFGASVGLVEEHEVDVVEFCLGESSLDGLFCVGVVYFEDL